MRAGKLDRVIIVERSNTAIDAAGRTAETWSRFAIRRAELVTHDVTETNGSAGATTNAEITFRLRFLPGVTLADRIVFDGALYDVKEIVEVGRRRAHQITAKRVGA